MLVNEELRKPFADPKSICRCVCEKCRNIFEIDEEICSGFLNTMKLMGNSPEIILNKSADFNKWFFEINYCQLCGREKEVRVTIKYLTRA